MKEYSEEKGKKVDLNKIRFTLIGSKEYADGRKTMVRGCHDIFIKINGGILLVERKSNPAKGELWSIGGGIEKGTLLEESLRKKVKEECNLEIADLKYLDVARMFWETDPNGHGMGLDDISFFYYGKGKGKLKLNDLHRKAVIITKENYKDYIKKLHPTVRYFLQIIIPFLKESSSP